MLLGKNGKMNWYKTALTKLAMTHKEFFEFYALQGLSNEALKENPVMLFRLIEIVNEIREYYLKCLLKEIANEMHYASSRLFDLCRNIGLSERSHLDEIEYIEKISRFLWSNPKTVNKEIQQYIVDLFNFNPLWGIEPYIGGPLWANIAQWTFELMDIGTIDQSAYNPILIQKLRESVHIIDVINSLEHNSNVVLSSLPQNEAHWLRFALDTVFEAPDPTVLADYSDNKALSELYRREILPLEQKREFTSNVYAIEEIVSLLNRNVYSASDTQEEKMMILSNITDPYVLYYILFHKEYIQTISIHISRAPKEIQRKIFNNIKNKLPQIVEYILTKRDGRSANLLLKFAKTMSIPREKELIDLAIKQPQGTDLLRIIDVYPNTEITPEILLNMPISSLDYILDFSKSESNYQELVFMIKELLDNGRLENKIIEERNIKDLPWLWGLDPAFEPHNFEALQDMVISAQDAPLAVGFALKFSKNLKTRSKLNIPALQKVVEQYGSRISLQDFLQIPGANKESLRQLLKEVKQR